MMFLHAEDAGLYLAAMILVLALGAWSFRLVTRRCP